MRFRGSEGAAERRILSAGDLGQGRSRQPAGSEGGLTALWHGYIIMAKSDDG